MTDAPGTEPFWVKCAKCCHIWAAAYLPMECTMFGKVAKHARCPKCGATPKNILVARQTNGVLQERASDAHP